MNPSNFIYTEKIFGKKYHTHNFVSFKELQSDFKKLKDPIDCYYSSFLFTKDILDYVKQNGSEAQYPGACFTQFLRWDIDKDNPKRDLQDNIADALRDARKLIEKLRNLGIEDKYIRAARGGTGDAKCCGNYAASLLATEEAIDEGYAQVLWLDALEKKYVEEVGTMNIFFVIDGVVVTSPLTDSILPGITRDSVLQLCKSEGLKVEERNISIDEIIEALDNGKLDEAFGSGTAAVITSVGLLGYKGKDYTINDFKVGKLAQKLYDILTGIQWGKIEDKFGWTQKATKD